MTTLPNMSIVLPTRGAAGAGTWHDALDAALTITDGHTHQPGSGARITSAALNINADVSFASLYAPTNLHRLSFASVSTPSTNKSLFVGTDHELRFRNSSGTSIQITDGTSLNVAAFTGGIGGDYASVGAEVAFDDAGDRYTFKQNSATGWARLASGEVRILETGSGDSVYVGLAAPAALAASHTITLPLAAPAAEQPVSVTSAGVLVFGHGDRVLTMTALAAAGQAGANWTVGSAGNAAYAVAGAAANLIVPVDLLVGERIKSVSFLVFGDGAADLTTEVYSTVSAMTGTLIGTATTTNQPASWSTVTIDVTDTTLAALASIQILFSASAANIRIGNISITYDRP
jgi:hypothetical protein